MSPARRRGCGMVVAPVLGLAVLAALLPAARMENAFTFELAARGQACFYETVDQGGELEIEFQVVEGGNLDVTFYIRDPNGRRLQASPEAVTEDEFELGEVTVPGDYEICFQNHLSIVSYKHIWLSINADNNDEALWQEDAVSSDEAEMAANIHATTLRVHKYLYEVKAIQNHLRAREARHRQTQESNAKSVMMWSAIECFVVIVSGVCQVLAVRRFFREPQRGSGGK